MNIYRQIANAKAYFFDVDGVFTNSSLYLTEDGSFLRIMNTRDGYAIRNALNKKLHLGVITGGNSINVAKRMATLGVEHVYSGITDKRKVLKEHLDFYNIKPEECLFMGDDYPDLQVMKFVGIPVCPNDAAPEIQALSSYISPIDGGHGCVRDVLELAMRLNGQWR